jgi:subtilisin family serine protease
MLYKQAFTKAINKKTGLLEDGYICIIYTSNAVVLKEKNINVQSVLPKFVTAWITPQQLIELVDMPSVNYIDVPKIVMPNNDIAVGSTGASLLQAGKLNNTIYKGDGVIVGVFDTGIDWDHLDFRNPTDTSKSRILKLWDQTITPISGETSPTGFNYGVEYTQAHLNNEFDGTPTGYVREKDLNGHGTHVAGTAAGNGASLSTRKFAGVAPNADLVIVKGGNSSFSEYNEINAMTYFQNVANAFGKPIVVNMSIGAQFGAHDGSNPDEIAVDNFCNSSAGRVVCISAGNDNGKAIHTQVSIAANGTGSVVVNVPTASGSSATDVFQISLYVNDTSSVNATITLPNGSTITANAGQSISPGVLSGAATAYFDNYIDADSKDRLINLYVVRSSTSANPSGTWTITFTNTTNKAIRIDGWLNYKGTNFGSTTVTGGDNNYLVGSPGNCTNAITVASYVGKLDWHSTSTTAAGGYQYSGATQQDNISTFSSIGPRRDDVQKPTITATGQAVVSCLSSDAGISPSSNTVVVQGFYRAIQGTSMSSPVVAGCVALMLQTKPSATFTQIKNAITATATKDNFTGANTNYIFGAGKIDVFKAASSLNTCTTFNRETISYDSSTTSAGNTSFSLSANKAATRFTATLTGKLGGVYFKTTTSIPTNSFTIELRSSDGTNPADLLGSLSVTPASIAKFSWNYYDVTSLNIDVLTGTDYWVVLVPASNDSWGLGYESISNSGRSKYSNGSSWTSLNGDFRIRTVLYNNSIPSTSSTTNITACNSFTWNDNVYITSGTYNKTGLVNAAGCDSTATINLTINSSSTSTTNITACNSYAWNGVTYTTSGAYTYATTNTKGCDSLTKLNLFIKQSTSSTNNISICSNLLPYSWNGLSFSTAGSQTAHLANAVGCDSAATLNLSIKATSTSTTNLTINSSQLPYSWNGLTFNAAGSQTAHLANAVGCDSAATLNLTVNTNLTLAVTGANAVCVGSTVTLNANIAGGIWTSLSNRATVSSAGVVTGGNQGTASIKYVVTNNGVVKTATYNLAVYAIPTVPSIVFATGTTNPQAGAPTGGFCVGKVFNIVGIPAGGVWSANGSVSVSSLGQVTINAIGAGSIKYTYTNSNNCSNSRTMVGTGYVCAARSVNDVDNRQPTIDNSIFLYPNPAKNSVSFNINWLVGSGKILVIDYLGKTVKTQALSLGINSIDIAGLSKGVYFISTITNQGNITKKLIVE